MKKVINHQWSSLNGPVSFSQNDSVKADQFSEVTVISHHCRHPRHHHQVNRRVIIISACFSLYLFLCCTPAHCLSFHFPHIFVAPVMWLCRRCEGGRVCKVHIQSWGSLCKSRILMFFSAFLCLSVRTSSHLPQLKLSDSMRGDSLGIVYNNQVTPNGV